MTGGTTGAMTLNAIIFETIPYLTKKYTVVHQTGDLSFSRARTLYRILPQEKKIRYSIHSYLDVRELSWVFHHASLVVGRSGANTIGEMAALGKVGLYIPLPWSAESEQQQNAQILVRAGSAVSLDQQTLTPAKFIETIDVLFKHNAEYQEKAEEFARVIPRDGSVRIVEEIESILSRTT